MTLLERRRMMVQAAETERTVEWFKVTLSEENNYIDTWYFTTAFIDEYKTNKPKIITLSLYPVIPASGTKSQTVGFYVWYGGGYADQGFPAYNNQGLKTIFGDGSEVCAKAVLTQTSGNSYNAKATSNNGSVFTREITFNPGTKKYFRATAGTKFGVGSRLVITATY